MADRFEEDIMAGHITLGTTELPRLLSGIGESNLPFKNCFSHSKPTCKDGFLWERWQETMILGKDMTAQSGSPSQGRSSDFLMTML